MRPLTPVVPSKMFPQKNCNSPSEKPGYGPGLFRAIPQERGLQPGTVTILLKLKSLFHPAVRILAEGYRPWLCEGIIIEEGQPSNE